MAFRLRVGELITHNWGGPPKEAGATDLQQRPLVGVDLIQLDAAAGVLTAEAEIVHSGHQRQQRCQRCIHTVHAARALLAAAKHIGQRCFPLLTAPMPESVGAAALSETTAWLLPARQPCRGAHSKSCSFRVSSLRVLLLREQPETQLSGGLAALVAA